jgi:hypothetical protein
VGHTQPVLRPLRNTGLSGRIDPLKAVWRITKNIDRKTDGKEFWKEQSSLCWIGDLLIILCSLDTSCFLIFSAVLTLCASSAWDHWLYFLPSPFPG